MRRSRRDFIKYNSAFVLGSALFSSLPIQLFAGSENESAQGADLTFVDGFTRIGPRRYKHSGERWTLDELVKELDHCSVSGALVASTLSLSYDAMHSNLELSSKLKPYRHLFPVWNVLPSHTNECLPPRELKAAMAEHNVRAVTVFPASNGWDWSAGESKDLLDMLSADRILTITSFAEMGTWKDLRQFLGQFPQIPLLMTGINWSEQRYAIALLKEFKNFHVSFEKLQINEGIEFLHKEGLADQLIFASDAPTMSVGAHRTYVDYADVPREVRAKVAGGNLLRLLRMQPPPLRINQQEDILMKTVRSGKPLPVPVIDMHMHMLHEGLNGAGGTGYHMENGGPQGIFRMMERIGCVGGGFMSWNGVVSNDSVEGNKLVRSALDVAPEGFWGLATMSPTHYSQQQLSVMIPEVYADKRIIGMKPYHFYGMEYHNKAYDIWWEFGSKNKLYALIHPTRTDLSEVETLAAKYPEVRWVIAHAGGSYAMADMAISAMTKYRNVFAELTLTPVPLGIIEYMVRAVGDDRILYGSDLPMRDPRQQLGWVVFSDLPLESKRRILGQNAFSVIRPCFDRLPLHNRPVSFR